MTFIEAFLSPTGIKLQEMIGTKISVVTINPFLFFEKNIDSNPFGSILNIERMRHPSSAENALRESASTIPGIGPSFPTSRVEDQVIFNKNNPSLPTSDTLRIRGSYQIPFTLLIWITSFILAFAENRGAIISRLLTFGKCPKLLSEIFKRTRTGVCGKIRILIGLAYSSSFDKICEYIPAFRDSVYDPKFLLTESGLQTIVTIYSALTSSEHNYIPFVNATIQTLPQLDSGTFITYTSLTVTKITENQFSDATIGLLPGYSYPNKKVPSTHLSDATITYQVHSGDNVVTSVSTIGEEAVFSGSTTTILNYIVDRVLGIEPNPTSHVTSNRRESRKFAARDFDAPSPNSDSKDEPKKLTEARQFSNHKRSRFKSFNNNYQVIELISQLLYKLYGNNKKKLISSLEEIVNNKSHEPVAHAIV